MKEIDKRVCHRLVHRNSMPPFCHVGIQWVMQYTRMASAKNQQPEAALGETAAAAAAEAFAAVPRSINRQYSAVMVSDTHTYVYK